MLVALAAVVVGLALAVGLAWLALSGLLAMAFRRARTLLRRLTQRRQSPRPDSPDRRHEERRAH
jgi:membrane protein implicated in regulation of membrane protease activity